MYNYLTSEPSKPGETREPSKPDNTNKKIKLTKRQQLIMSLLAIGLSNSQIASQMKCSTSTIQNTINLMYKNAKIGSNWNKRARLIFLYNESRNANGKIHPVNHNKMPSM